MSQRRGGGRGRRRRRRTEGGETIRRSGRFQKRENAKVQTEQSYIPEIRGGKLWGVGKRQVTSGACESENKRIMRDDDEWDTGLEQY
jgi:hypothetical protein